MTILGGVLGMGRAQASQRFTETFKVFRVTQVLNETTGLYVDTEVVVYASVAGQLKFPSLTVREREQGAQVPAVQDILIKVAVGSTPLVQIDHLWRCTASTVDVSLVGRVVRTKGLPQAGQVTSHRYPVEAVS